MAFKNLILASTLVLISSVLTACGSKIGLGEDENNIGQPLQEVSGLSRADGQDSQDAVIFDETTRKIHIFELAGMKFLRSYSPNQPGLKHVVLSHDSGNYVIDFYEKGMTVYSKSGLVQQDPLKFMGQPLSAALSSTLNLLIMYDDTNAVGFMKMNAQGTVIDQWVAGPQLMVGQSIRSGDLLANGKLILGLSDGTIGIVDVAQSLTQKTWVFESFASTLTSAISWIAPVQDNANQIFARAGDELAIFDIQTKTKVTSRTLTDQKIEKMSKITHGHIVTRVSTSPAGDQIRLFYAKASTIHHRDLQKQGLRLLSSNLNLVSDQWTIVDQIKDESEYQNLYWNNLDQEKTGRTLKAFRVSDMLALQKTAVPDRAQALLSPTYLFNLFPSELGYATRVDLLSLETKEAKYFNMSVIGE